MGFDAVTGATMMGHAKKDTYLKLYAHMFESTKGVVADKLDEIYGQKNDSVHDSKAK